MPAEHLRAPTVLEHAADLIDAAPGLNALDALREAHLGAGSTEQEIGDTYYGLLAYLPADVELIAPWSDRETPDRVAGKLRQYARTLRRGGPARIEDQPYVPAPNGVVDVVDHAAGRNRKARKTPEFASPVTQLRHDRGVLESVLTRQRKARHPDPAKITATELRLADVQRELEAAEAEAAREREALTA